MEYFIHPFASWGQAIQVSSGARSRRRHGWTYLCGPGNKQEAAQITRLSALPEFQLHPPFRLIASSWHLCGMETGTTVTASASAKGSFSRSGYNQFLARATKLTQLQYHSTVLFHSFILELVLIAYYPCRLDQYPF